MARRATTPSGTRTPKDDAASASTRAAPPRSKKATSSTRAASSRSKKADADDATFSARASSRVTKAKNKTVEDQPTPGESTAQSPREARRLLRVGLSREQILDTAERIFAEHGYHEAGLKEVAAECEFSVGSIYSFFENKDDLYKQVLMRRSLAVEAIQQLAPESMPADKRLVELARIQIEHAKQYPDWATLTSEISRTGRQKGAVKPIVWTEYLDEVMRFLVTVIKKGQREGTLRQGSPTALATLYNAVNMAFVLVSTLSQDATTPDNEWSADIQGYLDFVQDTFSTAPIHAELPNYDE